MRAVIVVLLVIASLTIAGRLYSQEAYLPNSTVNSRMDTIYKKTIHFAFGVLYLPPQGEAILKTFFDRIPFSNVDSIVIIGHTDSTEKVNEPALDYVRSAQVVDWLVPYLMEKNVDSEKLPVANIGLGATQPISTNKTKEGRDLNRRVEIYVYARRPSIEK